MDTTRSTRQYPRPVSSKRFPYGQPIDWSLSTAERRINWFFVAAAGLGLWRAWEDGEGWSIPLLLVAGYLMAVGFHHRSQFGEPGRLEAYLERAERRSILYLWVIPIAAVSAFVVVLAMVVVAYEAITG